MRIFYGRTIVNKLTIKPLNWAMRALLAKFVFQILSLFVIAKEICWRVTLNKTFIEMIYDRGSVLTACYYLSLFAYGFCYIAFAASIFIEQRILWFFIYFQVTTPFELLDVKKSDYQKKERNLNRRVTLTIWAVAALSAVLYLVILTLNQTEPEETNYPRPQMIAVSVYMMVGISIVVFCRSMSLVIGNLYITGMYYFQRFEYKRHRCRVAWMVFILLDSFAVLSLYAYFLLQI